jgi:hypothetical protein
VKKRILRILKLFFTVQAHVVVTNNKTNLSIRV